MMGLVLGFGKPRNPILGMVLAGVVESVGREALTADGKYQSVDNGSPKGTVENLKLLKQLAETGAIRPVIDRCYPLEQIVEAHRYVDRGHKKGNVVITIGHDE
jgi:D-arabinose 1-dehydrogenase-like Zn-dependent alcohol dehydrogenase